jgi:hypothetical protein
MKIKEEIKAKVMLPYLGVKVDLSKTQWYKQESKLRNRFIEAILAGGKSNKLSTIACIEHNIKTQNNGLQWLNLSAFKLILKPLSEITDKEVLEVAKLNGYRVDGSYKNYTLEITKDALLGKRPDVKIINVECWQYLISRGYDLPQYLLGGKTLKQAGLAIYKKLKK